MHMPVSLPPILGFHANPYHISGQVRNPQCINGPLIQAQGSHDLHTAVIPDSRGVVGATGSGSFI